MADFQGELVTIQPLLTSLDGTLNNGLVPGSEFVDAVEDGQRGQW